MCFPLTRPIEVPLRSTRLDSTAPYTRIYLQVSVNKTLQIYSLPFLIVKNVFLLLFPPLCVYLHIKKIKTVFILFCLSLLIISILFILLFPLPPPHTSFILLFSLFQYASSHLFYPPSFPSFSLPPHTSFILLFFPISLPPHTSLTLLLYPFSLYLLTLPPFPYPFLLALLPFLPHSLPPRFFSSSLPRAMELTEGNKNDYFTLISVIKMPPLAHPGFDALKSRLIRTLECHWP